MLVKVCGITRPEDAVMIVENGASGVGVIIDVPVETPRKITVEKALRIKKALEYVPHNLIAVMMYEKPDDVLKTYGELRPHGIQLHGGESPEFVREVNENVEGFIIKTIHATQEIDFDYVKAVSEYADMMLVDTMVGGKVGGTGEVHDMSIDARVREVTGKPLMISGGLNAANIKAALVKVRPHAVDVCSGVESSPGVKDPEKLKQFMEIVNETG
ncbi:MAG: phosphoribosylanthranilate isomerase [Candidatus Altiarchaeota archaeon]